MPTRCRNRRPRRPRWRFRLAWTRWCCPASPKIATTGRSRHGRSSIGSTRSRSRRRGLMHAHGSGGTYTASLESENLMSNLELVALVVHDYDAAIRIFVDVLQFQLVEGVPLLTNEGRPKRNIRGIRLFAGMI